MEYLRTGLQLKALKNRQIEGHGSVFGNVDLGGDVVLPGAFKRTLAEHKANGTLPQMFRMHDPSQVPGRWDSMAEDDYGLAVKGTLADTQLGNEMRTLAKMDAVRGLSIGYYISDLDYDGDGNRLLKSVDLVETSLVSLAMNPLAQITAAKARLSNAGEYVPTPRQFERKLRDVGLSSKVAKRVVSAVYGKERDVTNLERDGIGSLCDALGKAVSDAEIDVIANLTRL